MDSEDAFIKRNPTTETLGFEDVLKYVGGFGKFQKLQAVLLSLPIAIVAMHALTLTYVAATPKYRCFIPGWDDHVNSSQAWSVNQSMIYPWDADKEEYSKCLIYNVTVSNGSWLQKPDNTTAELTCTRWVYDTSQYKTTLVAEWNMVCDRVYLRNLAQSVYMAGMCIGALLFGDLSDRFGRKRTMFAAQVLQIGCGVALAFTPEYVSFVIFRFILGMSHSGVTLVAFVIGMEVVGKEGKVLMGLSFHSTSAIGFMLLALEGFFIREWKLLTITVTAQGVIFLVYIWDRIVSRSARWLLQNQRKKECVEILKKAAKMNGTLLPQDVLDRLEPATHHKASILKLFRYKRMRKNALIVFFNWFTVSMVYWGLSLTSSDIPGGSDYTNLALSGAVEFVGFLLCLITMDRLGRRPTLSMSMIFTGAALLCLMAVPKEMTWLNIIFSLTGKAFAGACFVMVYQYSVELFPTVVRNSVVGASSMCARIGGTLAPVVNLLGTYTHPYIPLITFGACSLLAGLLGLILPETLNREMPESLEQGEKFGIMEKPSGCCRRKPTGHDTSEELKCMQGYEEQRM